MQTTHKPIDFNKVESLRKHMLLTTTDMAQLFSVSRMTYYGWVQGTTKPRTSNEGTVKTVLRKLLSLMADGWPMPEVIAASPKQRRERLLELMISSK